MDTLAEFLAKSLQANGIDRVFGLPGGENVEVVDALRRAGIKFVLVRNEAAAVFMADVTARLTGKPGVCLTTLGPGATNATAGVAHAYLDRAPVLVITAQIPAELRPHHTHQFIDLPALFGPITKGSFELQSATAPETISHALELTQSGRPGPVHLQLSNSDAGQPVVASDKAIQATPQRHAGPDRIAAAQELLSQSRRPVIVTGLGLEPEGPYQTLRRLAEAANAPVITTPKSKGSLPADHPLSDGTIGLTRTDPAYAILDKADCILAVGFDVVELVKPWDQAAPLIWLAPWPNEDPTIAARVELVTQIEPALAQLGEVNFSTTADWGEKRVTTHRQVLGRQSLPSPRPGRLLPQTVLEIVRQVAPREAIFTTDVGSHKILASLTWPAFTPNSFFVSNGLSCMGFSLPAAIAASLSSPERPVICTTGDAGLAMVSGELGTLAELDNPVVVIVFNDAALDLIRSQQMRAGKPVHGTEFTNPDFIKIAEAYGIEARRVTNEAECVAAAQMAIRKGGPVLIEAMIDPVSYPTTPG